MKELPKELTPELLGLLLDKKIKSINVIEYRESDYI